MRMKTVKRQRPSVELLHRLLHLALRAEFHTGLASIWVGSALVTTPACGVGNAEPLARVPGSPKDVPLPPMMKVEPTLPSPMPPFAI